METKVEWTDQSNLNTWIDGEGAEGRGTEVGTIGSSNGQR